MKKVLLILIAFLAMQTADAQSITYATGCVDVYVANGCGGPDLPATIPEGQSFRNWYSMNGSFSLFSRWDNGNVFGSDFRDGASNDLESNGGSDVPNVYLYAGHGICQNPPAATSSDFIAVCGNFGTPNNTVIGTSSRWGNGSGNLRFAFIDASCPMDLISLSNQWFPVFRGLHIATGHSGTSTSDALDSPDRGNALAAYTSNALWLLPHMSVGDAWMSVGTDDVQTGCCAVVIAAGNNRDDAIDRRENEKVLDRRSDPTPNWFAWRWVCR